MINLIIFGKPGAGKGTQAEILKKKYQLIHISTGNVFRKHIKKETSLGKKVSFYLNKGDLVPDEITIEMLEKEVDKNLQAKGFIFDGFPRTILQAKKLDSFLERKKMKIDAVLALKISDEELIKRLLNRGKKEGRIDDLDENKIVNRLKEYNKKTAPLRDVYLSQNKYYDINAEGTVTEITKRLFRTIESL